MKWVLFCCSLLCVRAAMAQSDVRVVINTRTPGFEIPSDFAGLSFETGSELPNKNRVSGHLFSTTNTPLITLFRNSGIHDLRVGGGTVDGLKAAIPTRADIDELFGFAKAVRNLKVIYSIRLLNGDPTDAAATARYIWEHYRPLLSAFAIGNEPDWKSFHFPPKGRGTDSAIYNYPSYLAQWRKFATAITNAAPGAKFVGPDTGDYTTSTDWHGESWTQLFANDEKHSGLITAVTQHFYVGGNPGTTTSIQGIRNMLSADWVNKKYPWLYKHNLAPVVNGGLSYRLTESNDYLFGIENASDTFASALWALDYLHWWAGRGCAGVDFHNKSWLRTDTIYLDDSGQFRIHPKAYAIKAFELGSHGRVERLKVKDPNRLNLTAYAVGDSQEIFLTIINKEYGADARAANVSVEAGDEIHTAAQIVLQSVDGNIEAKNGVTLGGVSINADSPWTAQWQTLEISNATRCKILVAPASATILKIGVEKN